jgi:predicted nucleic acid-binding protein
VPQDRVHDIVVGDERDDPHLAAALRAQLTRLARKGKQLLRVAVRAPHAGEAILEKPAVQVPPHLLVDEAPPEPVPPLEALLPLNRARHRSADLGQISRRQIGNAVPGTVMVPDAWFAALAIEAGCEWITLDRDYTRFPDLKTRLPE